MELNIKTQFNFFVIKINHMHDFEKLTVYSKAKEFNDLVEENLLSRKDIDRNSKDQLKKYNVKHS
jgi:hypothetical protein